MFKSGKTLVVELQRFEITRISKEKYLKESLEAEAIESGDSSVEVIESMQQRSDLIKRQPEMEDSDIEFL